MSLRDFWLTMLSVWMSLLAIRLLKCPYTAPAFDVLPLSAISHYLDRTSIFLSLFVLLVSVMLWHLLTAKTTLACSPLSTSVIFPKQLWSLPSCPPHRQFLAQLKHHFHQSYLPLALPVNSVPIFNHPHSNPAFPSLASQLAYDWSSDAEMAMSLRNQLMFRITLFLLYSLYYSAISCVPIPLFSFTC
jgi:hypothetical protein